MNGRRLLTLFLALTVIWSCGQSIEERPTDATLSIYLARHGQTDWNAEKRLQGGTDTELNATGIRQAEGLASQLEGVELDAIYSSALRRSRDTAEIVAAGRPVESLTDLNEQGLGKFEGQYLDGRDAEVVEEFRRRTSDPNDTLDGGESTNQHFVRVEKSWDLIRTANPSGQILIVGHGGTNTQILRALLKLSPEEAGGIYQANDELYLIELAPARRPRLWKLIPPDRIEEL